MWNRVRDFAPEDLYAVFADRRIVKASLMRITLHAVHAEDYAACHAAMRDSPRASRRGRPHGGEGLGPRACGCAPAGSGLRSSATR
ncbi:DNA glycosylase AlkZ-like family protein [Streptomyces sp. NBC_00448]|uniref:DNA glycosylase AlkZ-like family protein n=1 Tax=Streptomyces sp. NBC_00448 TaxID=2903652 RepID=UPI002E1D107F